MNSIKIRKATEGDINYVVSTMLKSYRDHTTWKLVRLMPQKEYNRRYRAVIERLCLLPGVSIDIACADDSDFILGFAITQPATIHYVHVREGFQRLGIAKQLIADKLDGRTINYSHQTKQLDSIKLPETFRFCPWLIIGIGD